MRFLSERQCRFRDAFHGPKTGDTAAGAVAGSALIGHCLFRSSCYAARQ